MIFGIFIFSSVYEHLMEVRTAGKKGIWDPDWFDVLLMSCSCLQAHLLAESENKSHELNAAIIEDDEEKIEHVRVRDRALSCDAPAAGPAPLGDNSSIPKTLTDAVSTTRTGLKLIHLLSPI